ncbi:MAG: CoA transferase [Dehalococcoidia bacterium]|nr:CoA transferase [Dehalococcoidia bacterium]
MLHDRLLAGVRFIDAGQAIAGPFAGSLLSDLGAEVIKVELPSVAHEEVGNPATKVSRSLEYRNKKSITLDMRKPEGAAILKRLIGVSDALVENYSPGTMEKWGLGLDQLAESNPDIIMLRVSGYGQTGPNSHRSGWDRIGQAYGGLIHVTGEPDRPPAHPGYMLGDYLTGLFGALAVVSAIVHRDSQDCHEPQLIDLALYESIFRFSGPMVPEFDKFGIIQQRLGTQRPGRVPGDQFETRDGKWLIVLALRQTHWVELTKAIGMPELATDPRFAEIGDRMDHVPELTAILKAWFAAHDYDEVSGLLEKYRVPFGPIYDVADILQDPHYIAREDIVEVDDPYVGTIKQPAPFPRLSHASPRVYAPAPKPGQHNQEIYGDLLGFSAGELEALTAAEVI